MKKLMIRIGLLLFVFAAVFAGVYFYQNREPDKEMVRMDKATLPVVYMQYGDRKFNGLHGYIQQMDAASMRDTLTPVGENREVGIVVDTYGRRLSGISYEVRSLNEERLIERTALAQWDERGETVQALLKLENLIEKGEEYLLTVCLTTEENVNITYYTRILMGVGRVEEKLDYVLDFSAKTFDKDEAESLIMYLESGSRGDNTNFGNVNIYSSFSQITWGDLNPVKVSEPIPSITDINGEVTSLRLEYTVQIKNMYGTTELCNVSEFYRTNDTPDRTYLLTFERKMNQKFRAVSENITASRINVGISSDTEIPVLASADGAWTSFVKERELWRYESASNSLNCIFSFHDADDDGVRAEWNQHEVRPVRLDGNGDLYFIVYGYMNRGFHEGRVGITLYLYREESDRVEEIFFLPYEKSFSYLKQSIGDLFYITPGNHLCFLLEESLYSVDLASLEYIKLIDGLSRESYVTNKEGNMIAWQSQQDIWQSFEIRKLRLDTNTEDTIASRDRIQVIGFIESDLVYGSVSEEDIIRTATGDTRIYMSRLYIVDENNRQVGSYYKEGYYFTGAEIDANMITLSRYQKTEAGAYTEATEDVITNNTVSNEKGISVTMSATELKKKEAGINLPVSTGGGSLKVSYAEEVTYPGNRQLFITSDQTEFAYYVYGKGRLLYATNDVSEAVRLADKETGVVVRVDGSYIWRRGNQNTSKTLSVTMPDTEESSLARALDAMLRYAGASGDSEKKLADGKPAAEIVSEGLKTQALDLSGCSLRQVLYFVDRERPVLARLSGDQYVLIVGFDAYNALLLDTTGRRAYRVGLEDGTELFQKSGNEFLTYGE